MLEALPYLLAMLAVVPLLGFAVTGSWRAAWRYCRDWWRSVLILLALGSVAVLAFMPG